MKPLRLLFGGSPCTHWSIAQKNNRETEPEGLGWELFKNYLIAKEKFKPDFFLYENNKSASQPIKDQISKEFGVGVEPNVRFTYINSALVSAQNRNRFYVTNFGDIEQPKDRGILLKDILETGIIDKEKAYCLKHQAGNIRDYFKKHHTQVACEPIRVGCMPSPNGELKNSQGMRIYSIDGKSVNQTALGGGLGAKTGLYAIPINITDDGKSQTIKAQYQKTSTVNVCCYTSTYGATGVAEKIGYATPVEWNENGVPTKAISCADGKTYTVYKVENGEITIKDKQYPIKLPDGYYIIRKLTVVECSRLQTMPDDYCTPFVSDTQAYRALGNGWTAEVIIHLLNHALKDIPRDTPLEVLSMYDGIATALYCLKKMGFTNITYKAYEIDPYAKKIASGNHPEIIQCGDAFDVRKENWSF